MLLEIGAVIASVKAMNDSLEVIKKAGGNAQSLVGLMTKWAKADEQFRQVELQKGGAMSYADSIKAQQCKRQIENFGRTLKDVMLMQGLAQDYNEIMARIEESRLAHKKALHRKKIRQRERAKLYKLLGSLGLLWVCFMLGLWAVIAVFF